jgi:zinc transporter ZupT
MDAETRLLAVFIASLVTAITTGFGALPLALMKRVEKRWLGIGAAVASGLMLAASHSLLEEASGIDAWRGLAGAASGLGLIVLANAWLECRNTPDVGDLHGADARKALLILGVMTAHSFAEGVGVGVSYGGGSDLGVYITAAIAVHNIPEGLAVALVLVPRGVSVWKASAWAVFTSLPQPLMAVPSYLLVSNFEPFLPVGLGVAAGAMIWMVFAELLPDTREHLSPPQVGTLVMVAFLVMMAFQLVLH